MLLLVRILRQPPNLVRVYRENEGFRGFVAGVAVTAIPLLLGLILTEIGLWLTNCSLNCR